ncbi:hypothetical protein MWU75_11770 [Ornithinimicrobium sp. F0845]|uniref:hypothetical protein n=1 Tax=Ornithinimicrobium sp. F0845 TaxID=2926412 RepID=UPI001FF4D79A|nr:hypothetical protein [Ornithinimicrobium sp. F0845]MCK0112818.1 hypothetical protein [Ornithinimicrobium sp. F0845]
MTEHAGPYTDHPAPEVLVDLALGHLTGPQRDAVVAHVADCPACRTDLDALSVAVEATLPAVPRAEPGTGFTAAVLDRLGMSGGEPAGPRPVGLVGGQAKQVPTPRSRRVPPWAGVAAAAVIGLGAGSGLTLALGDGLGGAPATEQPSTADRQAPTESPGSIGPEVSSGAALMTADGARVGTVSRSWSHGEPMLVVDIASGEPGRSYLCRLRLLDGSTQDAGQWTLDADRPNSWVIADPGVEGVDLVAESGNVWSSATL